MTSSLSALLFSRFPLCLFWNALVCVPMPWGQYPPSFLATSGNSVLIVIFRISLQNLSTETPTYELSTSLECFLCLYRSCAVSVSVSVQALFPHPIYSVVYKTQPLGPSHHKVTALNRVIHSSSSTSKSAPPHPPLTMVTKAEMPSLRFLLSIVFRPSTYKILAFALSDFSPACILFLPS